MSYKHTKAEHSDTCVLVKFSETCTQAWNAANKKYLDTCEHTMFGQLPNWLDISRNVYVYCSTVLCTCLLRYILVRSNWGQQQSASNVRCPSVIAISCP